jgi:hypothetical protein
VEPSAFTDQLVTEKPDRVKYPFAVAEFGNARFTPPVFVAVRSDPTAPETEPLLNVIV